MLREFYSLSFPATVIQSSPQLHSLRGNLWRQTIYGKDDMGNLDDGANKVNFVDNLVDKFH